MPHSPIIHFEGPLTLDLVHSAFAALESQGARVQTIQMSSEHLEELKKKPGPLDDGEHRLWGAEILLRDGRALLFEGERQRPVKDESSLGDWVVEATEDLERLEVALQPKDYSTKDLDAEIASFMGGGPGPKPEEDLTSTFEEPTPRSAIKSWSTSRKANVRPLPEGWWIAMDAFEKHLGKPCPSCGWEPRWTPELWAKKGAWAPKPWTVRLFIRNGYRMLFCHKDSPEFLACEMCLPIPWERSFHYKGSDLGRVHPVNCKT